ncbi:10630_t:CDS:2 [Racocetra fulgida]|uniref:10630_t:CDS:1 n=1 Tax=Racocetra fulgida TaxID=60492 RepID=A0A9N8Z0B4_9GLOM|nr:10630_t:CDS:2 [Racocetra fulgida]
MPNAGVKIYIGNLPERARPEDIKECFLKFGTVVNMELKGTYGFIVSVSLCGAAVARECRMRPKDFQINHVKKRGALLYRLRLRNPLGALASKRRMCDEAISQLNGSDFQGSHLRVEFAHAEKNGNFNKFREGKSSDTCFKCGQVGHWARECTSAPRELVSRKPGGRYDDRRITDSYVREPYNARENREKYDRDERYPMPPPIEHRGYDRPYDRYGREPPEVEYRREYRGSYDRPYERERDRPYERGYPDREYERYNRDNYDRNYYPAPRDGYERDGYERRALPPPDLPYPPRGRTGSPPPPRRGNAPIPPVYRGRSPLPPSRYPDPMIGPHPMRPPSPRTGIGGRVPPIPYSGRQQRTPSPGAKTLPPRRGPRTPN